MTLGLCWAILILDHIGDLGLGIESATCLGQDNSTTNLGLDLGLDSKSFNDRKVVRFLNGGNGNGRSRGESMPAQLFSYTPAAF